AAGTYYVYFDIVATGAKAANAATPINGTFEQSVGSTPTSWVISALNAGGGQNDEVYRTALGATTAVPAGCQTSATTVDSSPARLGASATGQAWMLLGYRDRCEDGNEEHIRISRDITVPSGAAAGSLTFNFQIQGWDGIANGSNYDWIIVSVNGNAVNHNNLGIANGTAPVLVIDNARIGRNNYSATYLDHAWKQATLSLAAYAGTTINLRIETRHSSSDNDYRMWVKLDDVVWSRQDATVGTAQGYGVNVISPNDTAAGAASSMTAAQRLLVRAQVDATITSATADLYNNAGTLVLAGILLYDNGTHGDVTAGDRIWTNDGSVAAQPTYTFLATDVAGTNWRVRAFAPDASTSTIGAAAGLVHRPGLPNSPSVQANFFNIDEQLFTYFVTNLSIAKSVATLRDPVNVLSSPKGIPGAWLEYTILVTNLGTTAVDANTVVVVDTLPTTVSMCVIAACSGATAVRYDASTSPVPPGLTFTYASHVTYSNNGTTFGYTPVPDANGFDAAVRAVRIAPTGAMAAPTGAGNPHFRLRFVVRVN
ncbi:MAG TPA: choice-of-anchor X domain-containing protein, partial [Pseudomonadales bacterium]